MLRLFQVLVMAVLGFFAYQYVLQQSHPAPARQTLAAVDSSDSKPPEAWKYGSPVQQQFYNDYWDKHPKGPAQRTDPQIDADHHMPSMWTPENPNGLTATAPTMPPSLERLPDVVLLKRARDEAYVKLTGALRVRDDVTANELYSRIVQINARLNTLIRQSR